MDTKVQMMLEKARQFADKTSRAAVRAADTAGKKATEVAQATRVNLQIFDLNTESEVLYKEIGKIVYRLHLGEDALNLRLTKRFRHSMKTAPALPNSRQSCPTVRARQRLRVRSAAENAVKRMCSVPNAAHRFDLRGFKEL